MPYQKIKTAYSYGVPYSVGAGKVYQNAKKGHRNACESERWKKGSEANPWKGNNDDKTYSHEFTEVEVKGERE